MTNTLPTHTLSLTPLVRSMELFNIFYGTILGKQFSLLTSGEIYK